VVGRAGIHSKERLNFNYYCLAGHAPCAAGAAP
jgi:hypothetical protein